ncbi:MAG: class II fructose-bisphosphate aldolase, partial [Candidatus Falkowbacteria bacterium]|nr:class II fructose-bisphosphate aldolase [Candidatus Falkowbacteria bacterium]
KGKLKKIPLASLEDVIKFVRETKVDTISAAVGTAHGIYSNEDIVFSLLKAIKKAIAIPFVLHGGSGVPNTKIKKAIKEGVNIINIGTDLKIAFCLIFIKVCLENQDETDPRNLLRPTIKSIEKVVFEKMKLFGSAGRFVVGETET